MTRRGAEERAFAPLDLLRLIASRRWLVLGTTLAVSLGGVGLALRQPPKFEATTTVLLDPSARGGLIGSLSMLSPLGGSVVATSEVAVLRSRDVVESVVRPPVAGQPATPDAEGYAWHVGLTTMVRDEALRVWPLFLAERAGAVNGRSPVLRGARLHAHAERSEAADFETPKGVRVEFLSPDRVRISTPSLFSRLGIADDGAREFAFQAGEPIDYKGLRLTLAPSGDVAGQSFTVETLAPYEAAEGLLARYWAAETTRNSGVIRLTVEDTDPYRAAETANALVENYLVSQLARRERRSEHTLGYIQELLDESRATLTTAQEDLVRLRSGNPSLIDLDTTGTLLIEELASLEARAKGMEVRERSLGEVVSQLKAGDTLALARLDSAVTGGLFVDPTTESYLDRLASMNAKYVELSQTFVDDHPRLEEVRGAADELLGLIVAQIESRISGIAYQRAELEAQHATKLSELSALPTDMMALAEPSLQIRTQQELIPELLANLKATEISDTSSAFVAQRLDAARPAVRVASPKLVPVAFVGAALGLILGAVIALLREPIAGRVRGRHDLEAIIPRPIIGAVPVARFRDLAGERGKDGIRSLRAAVKNLMSEDGTGRVLGLTSVGDARVRAGVTAELARAFAREGARVALVEGDLMGRELTRNLDLAGTPGVAEAVLAVDPEEPLLLAPAEPAGLFVLPAGAADDAARERAGGDALDRVLATLAADHDIVLVDLPNPGSPLLEAIAPKLGGLLLASDRTARRQTVRGARARIERAGGNLIAAFLLGADDGDGAA